MPKYSYLVTETAEAKGAIVVEDVEEAMEIAKTKILTAVTESRITMNDKTYSIELVAICPVCDEGMDADEAILWTMCWRCRNEFQEEDYL
jgi:hypothetical protein